MKTRSLAAVARALNRSGARYLVAGGIAVVAHGYGRLTFDLDLFLRLDPDDIRRAFKALARLGYAPRVPVTAEQFADPALRAAWVSGKGMRVLNLHSDRHRETPVDLFVEEPFEFDAAWERALVEEVAPGVPVRIVDLATLIGMKRKAGRLKDLDDVAQLERLADEDRR